MRRIFLAFLLFTGFSAYSQDIHRLGFSSPDELHAFFRYAEGVAPIIAGHRGGMEDGFPENSLEALEHTLRHYPAIFEVDPRLTSDSVIVLFHDATLERTSNGTGKLMDLTLTQVKALRLKDRQGKLTEFQIPTLEEAIVWAKGKTILNLDHKDVPLSVMARFLIRLDALAHVMVTVHSPEEAAFYLSQDSKFMFSAFIRNFDELAGYQDAGIPWKQLMAYVGPLSKAENKALYAALHERGVKVMVSAASSYDKGTDLTERAANYRKVISEGADVLESDYPIAVGKALNAGN